MTRILLLTGFVCLSVSGSAYGQFFRPFGGYYSNNYGYSGGYSSSYSYPSHSSYSRQPSYSPPSTCERCTACIPAAESVTKVAKKATPVVEAVAAEAGSAKYFVGEYGDDGSKYRIIVNNEDSVLGEVRWTWMTTAVGNRYYAPVVKGMLPFITAGSSNNNLWVFDFRKSREAGAFYKPVDSPPDSFVARQGTSSIDAEEKIRRLQETVDHLQAEIAELNARPSAVVTGEPTPADPATRSVLLSEPAQNDFLRKPSELSK